MELTNRQRREWKEYSHTLLRRMGVAGTGICAYPCLVVSAVAALSWYIRPDAPGAAEVFLHTLTGDGIVLATMLLVVSIFLSSRACRIRERHRWYRVCDGIAVELGRGRTLSGTVRTGSYPETVRIDEALQSGTDPARVLSQASCPAPLVRAFATAAGEEDLQLKLNRAIREYQEETMEKIGAVERIAQPGAIAVAGAAVLWLVIRVVIPYMTSRFETGVL